MARNDVYLNINALSPADAVVTGQQDMTAATVPELVLGDTPTFNFLFTDNTNVWPSWAGNAAYTLTWALSDAVAGDFAPAATTGNATPITGGWSVVLPLNSYDLVGLLNTKRVGQPYPVQNLWQQLRVTDPSGNEVTRAMFWTPVRYRAISDTQNTESASPTGGRFVTVNNVNTLTTPTAAQFYAANPVPTSALGTAANGELLIGNGTGFTKSTLTAGTGITVTNGSGTITIDASGAQELLTATVKNAESVAITKGQVVYLFAATGGFPSVKLAYNTTDATSAKTFGVVSDTSIAPNGTGTVTCVGVVDGLNLGAYQDGDTVYLGATPGSITATKPYAPNHLVYVGIIERANAGNGELYVRVQNGYELDEIHDVQITAPKQSGQTLIYDNTTSLWKNARITAGSNIAVTNGDGSISIGFSGTLPVANGGTGVTTSTGSGSVVLSTSPTLTTPILGTPQSGTLSSCTGLPISTGVSGLGTNVATFLATPSSANLASAVTDETGTGALVFANTPTLVTPVIGAATGTSLTVTGNVTASDAILGTSGPSVKSTLSARAPRQGLVFDGTAGATFTEQNTSISHTVRFVFNSTFDTTGRRYVAWKSASYGMGISSSSEGRKLFVEGSIFALGNTSLVAGKNYDCVFVYNGSTVTFYLNGIADGTTAAITTNNISRILETNQSGSVSGFLIYNRALSASEVVALYEAGAPAGADYNSASNTAINTSAFTNNGTFGLNYSTFSGASATGFTAAQATATAGMAEMKPNLSAKVGKRYRVSFTATLTSGQAPTFQTQDGSGNQCFPQVTVTNGANSFEVTMNSFASGTLVTSFYTSNVTSYAISNFSMVPLGLLLAPDAAQAGGGLVWYDTSGNAANITLPASGVSWNVPSSRVLGGNWTTSGNLTVSGTGTFSGNLSATGEISCNGSGGALRADSRTGSGLNWYIYNPTGADLRLFNSTGGNVLILTNAGAATLAGNLTVSGTTMTLSGSTFGIDMGAKGSANNPFFDFNSSGNNNDFDVRLQAKGGGVGSALGTLTLHATTAATASNAGAFVIGDSGTGTPTAGTSVAIGSGKIFTGSDVSVGGNLTVSGTGNSSVAGTLLVATTTNSSNGKLQLATHTTSAGGIGFGTDTSLYRIGSAQLMADGGAGGAILGIAVSGVRKGYIYHNATDFFADADAGAFNIRTLTANSILLKTNNTTALTLDSSQNATFAGQARLQSTSPQLVFGAGSTAINQIGFLYTSAGQYVGIAGNRNPNTGVFANTAGTHAGIDMDTGSAGSNITFRTAATANTLGTIALTLDKDQNATFAKSVTVSGGDTTVSAGKLKVYTGNVSSWQANIGSGANSGLYINGLATTQTLLGAGMAFESPNWIARGGTTASGYHLNAGAHAWYGDTGLTDGASFTPTLRMSLSTAGNLTLTGSLTTSAPTGGAGAWELGVYSATAPTATGYVTIEIGGVQYKLLAST